MHYKNKDLNVVKIVSWVLIGLVIAAGTAFLFGFVVMFLWNWLMPEIFGLPTISYIQAWGLVLMSHILFKSGHSGGKNGHRRFGKGHGHRGHSRGHGHRFSERSRGQDNDKDDRKGGFFSKMHEHDMNAQKEQQEKDEDTKD